MPLTVLNMALIGVIFVLLCYIWYLKNPCESWCSIYENCSNVYECCTWCCNAFDDGDDKQIGAFIVEKGTDGLRIGEPEDKMGWKGSDTRSVYFEDMYIPKENVLGNPSKGFKQ